MMIPECAANVLCHVEDVFPSPDGEFVLFTCKMEKTIVDDEMFDTKILNWKIGSKSLGKVGRDEKGNPVESKELSEQLYHRTLSSLSDTAYLVNGEKVDVVGDFTY
jgi:hypothetical protein